MAEALTPDICVIGGGPGGIALASGAALNAVPVVLVERGRMGGANLTRGALPSKALVSAASTYEFLRRGPALGVTGAPLQVNFAKVRDHIGSVAEAVAPNFSAERLTALGATVIAGEARFTDRNTVTVGDIAIRARRFVIATGVVLALPPIPGIEGVDCMTADTAFDVTRKPNHLLVIGANSRGLELAQSYNRLGVDTTVIDEARALADDDPELAAVVLDRLRAEGVRVRAGVKIAGVARRRGGIRVTVVEGEREIPVDGSHLLLATGKVPNVEGLGLDAAGIIYDRAGISVDRQLRTTNRRVYAIGDVVAGAELAGRAEYQAERVLKAILYRLPLRQDTDAVPAVTFTDPALAKVGLSEVEADRRHNDIRVLRVPLIENDLAQVERMPAGLVKVVTTKKGRILGAAIVGHDAGEMIALWSLAIARRLDIGAMAAFVPPYPSRAEVARRVAARFNGPGLTPPWRRRIIEFLRRFG
jgi:pyruvate/2-oxoglutarate dehydrogenase complex dihydrolipoamide dehydrogenase (E3) component